MLSLMFLDQVYQIIATFRPNIQIQGKNSGINKSSYFRFDGKIEIFHGNHQHFPRHNNYDFSNKHQN